MEEDTYLSWEQFDEIKQYISTLFDIKSKWNQIEGTMIDNNEFIYNLENYHIFLSCRKNYSFGFGIAKKPTMETIINETIPYNNYKQNIFNKLHNIFNFN